MNALLPLEPVTDIPIRFDTCIQVVANLKHFVKISALWCSERIYDVDTPGS